MLGRPVDHYDAIASFLYANNMGSEHLLNVTRAQRSFAIDKLNNEHIKVGYGNYHIKIPQIGPGKEYWRIRIHENIRNLFNVFEIYSHEKKGDDVVYHDKDYQAQGDLPSQWRDNYVDGNKSLKRAQDSAQALLDMNELSEPSAKKD